MTYANECFAAKAGLSIARRGQCETGPCAASRVFEPNLNDTPWFCPGTPRRVTIVLNPPDGTSSIGVEDVPPAGWEVLEISDGGSFDEINRKVKWGPFFPPYPKHVHYQAMPTNAGLPLACFDGTISLDGISEAVCGIDCLGLFCPLHMGSDVPQPACPSCPVGDCLTCGDGCRNGRISLCELIGYACAWKTGCNDDLAGMTRAAYVWKNGECYCWSDSGQSWMATDCPPPPSGLCEGESGRSDSANASAAASAVPLFQAAPQVRSSDASPRSIEFALQVVPPPGTSAVAFEVSAPPGWSAAFASHGGELDSANTKIKWGPFMDDAERTIILVLEPVLRKSGKNRPFGSRPKALQELRGTISYDGVNQPVTFVTKR
jgi:hypothetical protein